MNIARNLSLTRVEEGTFLRLSIIGGLITLELIIGLSTIIIPYKISILFLIFLSTSLVFFKPKYGYLLMLATLPVTGAALTFGSSIKMTGQLIGRGEMTGVDPLVPLTAIVVICYSLKLFLEQKKIKFKLLPIDFPLITFLGLTIISILWCPGKETGIFFGLKFLFAFLLYFLTVIIIEGQDFLRKVISFWVYLGIFYALIGLVLNLFLGGGREPSSTDNPNLFAGILNFCLLLALGKFFSTYNNKPAKKLFLAPGIILMLAAHLLTGSRSGLIGLNIGIILFLFFIILNTPRSQRFLKASLAGSVFVILLVLTVLTMHIFSREVSFREKELGLAGAKRLIYLANPLESQSFKFRLLIWKYTFKLLSDNPWFYLVGGGTGGFTEKSKGYRLRKLIKQDIINHPHNIFLSILADYGILGILITLWFLVSFINTIIYASRKIPFNDDKVFFYSFICGIIAYFPLMMIEISLVEKPHWMFLGLGIAMIKHFTHKDNSNDNGTKTHLS